MPEFTVLFAAVLLAAEPQVFHAQGEMAGEVTPTSVSLQSRLTSVQKLTDGDVPGITGVASFEMSEHDHFRSSRRTDWLKADVERDFIIKVKVDGLKPATRYYYRLVYGGDQDAVQTGETCSFRTLQGNDGTDEASFVVVTGMNYMSFHYGKVKNRNRTGVGAYQGDDKQLGFPALATIVKMKPDFFVGTGDNVYYDSHDDREATELKDLRRKWHEQLIKQHSFCKFE